MLTPKPNYEPLSLTNPGKIVKTQNIKDGIERGSVQIKSSLSSFPP